MSALGELIQFESEVAVDAEMTGKRVLREKVIAGMKIGVGVSIVRKFGFRDERHTRFYRDGSLIRYADLSKLINDYDRANKS